MKNISNLEEINKFLLGLNENTEEELLKKVEEFEQETELESNKYKIPIFYVKINDNSHEIVINENGGFGLRAFFKPTDVNISGRNVNNELYIRLQPFERRIINTGLKLNLPNLLTGTITSNMDEFFKKGLFCTGNIHSSNGFYSSEVKILSTNLSNKEIVINNGDIICELLLISSNDKNNINLIETKI